MSKFMQFITQRKSSLALTALSGFIFTIIFYYFNFDDNNIIQLLLVIVIPMILSNILFSFVLKRKEKNH
jgi:O-antigen/teichoic acid export membrane protein